MNEQARRSSPPNRVRYPTDQQFASGCSPPRLSTTQLPSATELWHTPTRTFTVLMWRPHGRTHPRMFLSGVQSRFDYTHHNPARRGLVKCPTGWPWSNARFWLPRTARVNRLLNLGSSAKEVRRDEAARRVPDPRRPVHAVRHCGRAAAREAGSAGGWTRPDAPSRGAPSPCVRARPEA